MSTPQQGASVAPYQGQAVTPSAVIDAHSVASHNFLSVISRLVRDSGVFRNEGELLQALDHVAAFAGHLITKKDHKNVVREHDIAPVEDVRLRKAPQVGAMPQPVGPAIDYALLAQYIVAAQAQAAQAQAADPEVHSITDVPEKKNGEIPASSESDTGF